MPVLPPLSTASGLVLRDLGKADGKEVIKQAIKELVACGVFVLERDEVPRLLRRPRTRLLLVPTGASSGGDAVLLWAEMAVRSAPAETVGLRPAHDLAAVAKSIAKEDTEARKHVVERAAAELEQRGLLRVEDRRTAGLFRRITWVRTPAGDALIGTSPTPSRRRRRDRGDGGGTTDSGSSGPLLWGDAGGDHDGDRGDGALDQGFDASFDASFDSSFDSGFSDGGGDGGGGGGDGGGGGGD